MKLDDVKVRYLIRVWERGESNGNIAVHLSVSRRRVEQLQALYKAKGATSSLWRGGRRGVPISEDERRVVLAAYNRYMVDTVHPKRVIEVDY